MSLELLTLLEHAAPACDEMAQGQIQRLRERLAVGTPRVLLVGEAKRGKSTLGNALLQRDLLPSGVLPVTAITTTIEQGSPEHIVVRFADGSHSEAPLDALANYVTEQANPSNERGVTSVCVTLEKVLEGQALLVDTPGVGSVLGHNTSEAQSAMRSMDLAVFVLTADPPISQTELDLLSEVREFAVATFVVLNKTDRLGPDELRQARDFVARITGTTSVFTCSARRALAAQLADDDAEFVDSGVAALAEALQDRLAKHGREDLSLSLGNAAHRVLSGALDRLRITQAALDAMSRSRRDEVDLFAHELSGEEFGTARAHALADWEAKRARAELDEEASKYTRQLSASVLAELDCLVKARGGASAEELATHGHQLLTDSIGGAVTQWRRQRLTALQGSLTTLTTQLQQDLDRVAASVEESSQRLLGVSVRPIVEPIDVPELRGFRLDFSPEIGWNTAMVEQMHRRMPARMRRRRAIAGVRRDATEQTAKHVGRARSDLQSRLEAATRQLHTQVESLLDEQRAGLRAALDAADQLEQDTRAGHLAEAEALEGRISTLTAGCADLVDALNPREARPTRGGLDANSVNQPPAAPPAAARAAQEGVPCPSDESRSTSTRSSTDRRW